MISPFESFSGLTATLKNEISKIVEQKPAESLENYPFEQSFSGMIGHLEIFRLAAETALRDLLLDAASLQNTENTFRLIDISLNMSKKNLLDSSTPLILFEDLMEVSPSWLLSKTFGFLAERVSHCYKDLSSSKGPGLVVLRIGNELIRRASKSSDAAFCGDVLLFLSKIFPSGERSGANLRGDLNVDNTISLEERPDAMLSNYDAALLNSILASAEDEIVPYSFYLDFWHLQHCFLHPHQTLQPEHWSKFCKIINIVCELFVMLNLAEENVSRQNISSPKFLSSLRLLRYQLGDAKFCESILLQMSIFFKHLLEIIAKDPRSSATDNSHLSEMAKWLKLSSKKVSDLLSGSMLSYSEWDAAQWLDRNDDNWINWKVDSCPPFKFKDIEEYSGEGTALPSTLPSISTSDLSQLWAKDLCASLPKSGEAPDLKPIMATLKDQLNPEEQIEAEYRSGADPVYLWKLIRLMSRNDQIVYPLGSIKSQQDLEAYLNSLEL